MTRVAQIFALGIVLCAGAAFADVTGGSSSPAPTPRQKRSADTTTGAPIGGHQDATAVPSDATKSPHKRHAQGSTAIAADADMTTPGRNKREATTVSGMPMTSSRSKKRSAEVMSSATVMPSTMGPRQKRGAMTDGSNPPPSTSSRNKRSAENTTPAIGGSSTVRAKRENPNGRKRRQAASSAAPSTPSATGGPHKRDAPTGTTSNPYPSTPAGRRKRHAMDSTATTVVRSKRGADVMSTTVPTTVSVAGRRKREATTTLMTGSPSGAPKKRSAEMTTVAPSGTPQGPRNRRSAEGTTAPSTGPTGPSGPKKRDAPSGMTSPNPMGTMTSFPAGVPNPMVGPAMSSMPPRQRRHAKVQPATPSTDESTTSNEEGTEVAQVTSRAPVHRFPAPQFIKDLTPEQRRQFFEIKSNFTLTKKEMHAQLQKWVQQQPENVQADYKTFHKNFEKIKNDIAQKIQANLSSEGKALFDKIKTYMDDDSLTMRQTCENIQQAMDAVPERVRDELHCNEHKPQPGGDSVPPPRRVDACHGHFSVQFQALVTGAPPANPQPVLLAATA